jgi:hypothetical protein
MMWQMELGESRICARSKWGARSRWEERQIANDSCLTLWLFYSELVSYHYHLPSLMLAGWEVPSCCSVLHGSHVIRESVQHNGFAIKPFPFFSRLKTDDRAKLLARLIRADGSLSGYTDIGRAAFGRIGGISINLL